ncbi:DUF4236 domain-containing protein [Desertibacillus haloalkaliphilus]|uniref:DUF4236 domain-containing protein n=1 Tax=Desertibacillus haloalkaliphilus TaxID=1328930 RepID=UPI001C253D91|nr:DUF4236 domain-containing protein [Desertibacillus haloalkaliphilus]MBU8907783.1 DUF4236 domain-containing protein [Desertibacillus haloalkaliphilus]
MSFRFQKRVKVAPGVRLNFSKRGVSTSFGRRGASVSLGRQGLYGNVGIPGTGISYRTKLNKQGAHSSKTTTKAPATDLGDIQLVYRKDTHSISFIDEQGEALPASLERQLKKQFANEIQALYQQKEAEINAQTDRLLGLHKQPFPERTYEQVYQVIDEETALDLDQPKKQAFVDKVRQQKEKSLSTLAKLSLFLPSKRKDFEEEIQHEAEKLFAKASDEYEQLVSDATTENEHRKQQLAQVAEGDVNAIEEWLELHLAEVDFPLETNISFSVLTKDTIYLDVDLPEMKDIPLTKATILKSGKLKVKNKSQRETREHYAIMVGGTALSLCSFVFSLLPDCQQIIISGYTQHLNEATGHVEDEYIYSLVVEREPFYSLNFEAIHPIAAFENFQPRLNATKTYIFKAIDPYDPSTFRE